jgi:hypothetical protein
MLTLLKQARAFGLGVVLATQNPVDLDYKGLANAGTWFIGRLQTERDKMRVLEGLEGAAGTAGGKFDRQQMEQILAGLGNRVFLMNNVHDEGPVLFETRWAMSYLRGPLARPDIKKLMEGRKRAQPAAERAQAAPAWAGRAAPGAGPAGTQPVLPPEIPQYFAPLRSPGEPRYRPCFLAAAQVLFSGGKTRIEEAREILVAVPISDAAVAVNWDEAQVLDIPATDLEKEPAPGAAFGEVAPPAAKAKNYAAWQKAFVTWVYQTQKIELFRSPGLGIVSQPGEPEAQFRIRLQQQAREERDKLAEKLRAKYAPKMAALEERMRRARAAVQKEKEQSQGEMLQSVLSVGTSLLGAFLGGGRRGSTLSKAGTAVRSINRARRESADVARAEDTVEAVEAQLQALDEQFQAETAALPVPDPAAEVLETVIVKPTRTNISVQLAGLGWLAGD